MNVSQMKPRGAVRRPVPEKKPSVGFKIVDAF